MKKKSLPLDGQIDLSSGVGLFTSMDTTDNTSCHQSTVPLGLDWTTLQLPVYKCFLKLTIYEHWHHTHSSLTDGPLVWWVWEQNREEMVYSA